MIYKVEFTQRALKELKKLDRHTAALILGWVRKNLENCDTFSLDRGTGRVWMRVDGTAAIIGSGTVYLYG